MNTPRPALVIPASTEKRPFQVHNNSALSARPIRRATALTRRFQIASLDPSSGKAQEFVRIAPALPVFENAFASLARGTLIATQDGPVAIEDLQPGMMLRTADNGFQPVLWIGSMTIVPHIPRHAKTICTLMRVTADSLGLNRPMPDLMLAPGARMLHRPTRDQQAILSPLQNHCDGESIIRISPPTPVSVFHLAFARQQIIYANGLEIESYHPEVRIETRMSREMLALFLNLFPHVENLDDFGPAAPYLRLPLDQSETALSA